MQRAVVFNACVAFLCKAVPAADTQVNVAAHIKYVFMFFENLKIKYLKKIITAFGSASFGVYLISEQQIIKEVFIRNSLAEYTTEPWYIMISATVIYALIIYFVCACIDYIRIQLFYICKINKLLLILEKKITCISDLVIKKIYSKIKSHN